MSTEIGPHARSGSTEDWQSASTLTTRRPATATAATELRQLLHAWITALGVVEDTSWPAELACYEALANVVEHAYDDTGDMHMHATFERGENRPDELVITVTDHGRWQPPAAEPDPLRGRGIPLIHSLSDATIAPGGSGTVVTMRWHLAADVASEQHAESTSWR